MIKQWLTQLCKVGGLLLTLPFLLPGCTSIPDGITPVKPFDTERYLGQWYEIARLDNRFERGIQDVTAHYLKSDTGSVRVINRGYHVEREQWSEVIGKAVQLAENEGYFKVSFFEPFYGAYIVFWLDDNYQNAMVTSNSKDYLWLLSRSPSIAESTKQRMVNYARNLGFDTDALIFVNQCSRGCE